MNPATHLVAKDFTAPSAVLRRRAWLGAMAGMWLAPGVRAAPPALIQMFGKAPARIERVFAGGPPAAELMTALAPERLLGCSAGR